MLKTFSTSFNIVENSPSKNYTIPIFDTKNGQKTREIGAIKATLQENLQKMLGRKNVVVRYEKRVISE